MTKKNKKLLWIIPLSLVILLILILGAIWLFAGFKVQESVSDQVVDDTIVEEVQEGQCSADEDCGAGYYCLNNVCLNKEEETVVEEEVETTTSSSSHSGGGGGSSGGSSGGSTDTTTTTLSSLGGSCTSDSSCVSGYICDNYVCAEETLCNDFNDRDDDGTIDYTGGCDTDSDGDLDYVCGCYSTVTSKFELFVPYTSSSVCEAYSNSEYACSDFNGNFVSINDVDIEITEFCSDALTGVYYNADADCSLGNDNTEGCETSSDCNEDYACVTETTSSKYGTCVECEDTDGSNAPLVYGVITGVDETTFSYSGTNDYCISPTEMHERYCKVVDGNTYLSYETVDCTSYGENYYCNDGVCAVNPDYAEPENSASVCGDLVDNDGDGLTDCDDDGCLAFCVPEDVTCESLDCGEYDCADGVCYTSCDFLDDFDISTDIGCADGYYCNYGICDVIPSEEICSNLVDDNGDSAIDTYGGCDYDYDGMIDLYCASYDGTSYTPTDVTILEGGPYCDYWVSYADDTLYSSYEEIGTDNICSGAYLDGVYHAKDSDCVMSLAPEGEKNIFVKFLNWLLFF